MSDWQPISTAPTDHTYVLVSYNDGGVTIARQNPFGNWTEKNCEDESAFYLADPEIIGLTHWMPLPEPAK